MSATAYKIRLQVENQMFRSQLEEIVAKKSEFVIQDEEDTRKADLLILELNENSGHVFDKIQNLSSNGQVTEVFLTSESTDHNILINAMRSGAREFFGPDTQQQEITNALERFVLRQARARSSAAPSRPCQIISVMGSKGGVGTTTIAVNLAVSLASRDNNSVALLDMNLFGDIPLFLEIEPSYSWGEIAKNISRLDSTFLKNILSVDPSGVYVLPSPSYLDNQNMATPDIIERLYRVMCTMFDYVIVDVGQLLNDTPLKILQMSDRVFLVAVQSLPCLAKTNKILRTFRDLGYPNPNEVHIILNRFVANANIDKDDVEKSLDKKLYWSLPNDYMTTISAINKGQPLAKIAPKKNISRNFMDLAESLHSSQGGEAKKRKRWWLFN